MSVKQIVARLQEDAQLKTTASGRWDEEHEVSFKVTGEASTIVPRLLHALHCLGSMGSSRTITVEDFGDEGDVKFGFDGDGADKLYDIMIDGKPYEPEE